ncbi:MAG: hypothetical protein CMI54_06190 [Parcubacteria group bacterium]|jgi:hypothetical protein|nr:hypothetical protein [Parcubacteria group bacterium]|tara:strand:+ start:57 stop:1007 length:951 start_codon:yes stop_codon:yes gene_type:complete
MSDNIGICTCAGNINNLGEPDCLVELQAPSQLWFSLRTKVDGSDNVIDPSQTLDQTYFETFLHADEAKDRYLPLLSVKNFTPEADDATTDEASDGSIEIINEGINKVTYTVWTKDPYKFKKKINTLKCQKLQYHVVDRAGNLLGEQDSNGMLAGRKIAVNTMVAKVIAKSDDGTNKFELSFTLERSSGDEKVDYITSTDVVSPYSLVDVEPLKDVNITHSGVPTTTSMTFSLALDHGSMASRIAVEGLTTSHLEGYDTVGDTTVTFLTLTDVDGLYTATYAAETAGDTIRVQGISTTVQNGFDLKRIDDSVSAPIV